jgi:hypothetical protein
MYLNKNLYKIIHIKNMLKKNNFLFFFSGLNKNSEHLLSIKKKFKIFKFNPYKIINKITIKLIKNSTKCFSNFLINGSLFLIKCGNNKIIIKSILTTHFYFLFPIILALKLNNKIYSFILIKKIHSFNYFQNKWLINQFCILKLKKCNTLVIK